MRKEQVVIVPNPVTNDSRILLPYSLTGDILVVNSLGQTIMLKHVMNGKQLPLPGSLLPGIYYYRISDVEHNKAFTGQFTVE